MYKDIFGRFFFVSYVPHSGIKSFMQNTRDVLL